MKTVIVLLVIAGLAFGGWYAVKHQRAAAAAAVAEETSALAPPQGSAPVLQPAPVLPAEAQEAITAADALWNGAGPTPASSAKNAELSRLYSKALRALYNKPGLKERENELVEQRLKPLGDALFFSRTPVPADDQWAVHVVGHGESPEGIAKKYGLSRELLNRFRGHDANDSKLRAGDSFKVIRLAGQSDPLKRGFKIHIDKGDYLFDLYVGGMFARRYTCSHGAAATPTPVGSTHIVLREWHPNWTHPITHQVIPYGHPDHLLGPVWMQFDAKELGRAGIGIHGYTGADAKWGAQVSNGCIRLPNEQAEEVFQTISSPERSPTAVEITD